MKALLSRTCVAPPELSPELVTGVLGVQVRGYTDVIVCCVHSYLDDLRAGVFIGCKHCRLDLSHIVQDSTPRPHQTNFQPSDDCDFVGVHSVPVVESSSQLPVSGMALHAPVCFKCLLQS